MADRVRRRAWAAILVAASTVVLASARAQQVQQIDQLPPPPFFAGDWGWAFGSMGQANQANQAAIQRQGDWAEVIMANGRWVVLQDARGRQYPVAFESIRQFVVRWPARLDRAAPDALVEATGADLGSNTIQTDHVDLYEGPARNLVTPAMFSLNNAGMATNPVDISQSSTYGTLFPFVPFQSGMPARIHIVGGIVGLDPLRLAAPGNNSANVLPGPDGMNVTQVTTGQPSYVKKGDLVYFLPEDAGPKSLVLGRMILYKKVPLATYNGGNK